MLGSDVLDVAIGLAFVYLLMALLCSAVTELISSVRGLRAQTLKKGIGKLVGDGDEQINAYRVLSHKLVSALGAEATKIRLPQVAIRAFEKSTKWNLPQAISFGGGPSYLSSRSFRLALWDLIASAGSAEGGGTLAEIRNTVVKCQNETLKQALLPLIDDAEGDIRRARENVERWFDESMDRASGWYKRHAQKIVIGAAVCSTVLMNVDTVDIATALYRNAALRESLVAAAVVQSKQPVAERATTGTAAIKSIKDEINELGLPIGWGAEQSGRGAASSGGLRDPWIVRAISKLFGWLITICAISLGAPFWFDLLSKLVALRSTGKTPKTADQRLAEQPDAGLRPG